MLRHWAPERRLAVWSVMIPKAGFYATCLLAAASTRTAFVPVQKGPPPQKLALLRTTSRWLGWIASRMCRYPPAWSRRYLTGFGNVCRQLIAAFCQIMQREF